MKSLQPSSQFTIKELFVKLKKESNHKSRFSQIKIESTISDHDELRVSPPIYGDRNIKHLRQTFHKCHPIRGKQENQEKHSDFLRKRYQQEIAQKKKEFQNSHSLTNSELRQKHKSCNITLIPFKKKKLKRCLPTCGLFKIKCKNCKSTLDCHNYNFEKILKQRGQWKLNKSEQLSHSQEEEMLKKQIVKKTVEIYKKFLSKCTEANSQKIGKQNVQNQKKMQSSMKRNEDFSKKQKNNQNLFEAQRQSNQATQPIESIEKLNEKQANVFESEKLEQKQLRSIRKALKKADSEVDETIKEYLSKNLAEKQNKKLSVELTQWASKIKTIYKNQVLNQHSNSRQSLKGERLNRQFLNDRNSVLNSQFPSQIKARNSELIQANNQTKKQSTFKVGRNFSSMGSFGNVVPKNEKVEGQSIQPIMQNNNEDINSPSFRLINKNKVQFVEETRSHTYETNLNNLTSLENINENKSKKSEMSASDQRQKKQEEMDINFDSFATEKNSQKHTDRFKKRLNNLKSDNSIASKREIEPPQKCNQSRKSGIQFSDQFEELCQPYVQRKIRLSKLRRCGVIDHQDQQIDKEFLQFKKKVFENINNKKRLEKYLKKQKCQGLILNCEQAFLTFKRKIGFIDDLETNKPVLEKLLQKYVKFFLKKKLKNADLCDEDEPRQPKRQRRHEEAEVETFKFDMSSLVSLNRSMVRKKLLFYNLYEAKNIQDEERAWEVPRKAPHNVYLKKIISENRSEQWGVEKMYNELMKFDYQKHEQDEEKECHWQVLQKNI